MSRKARGCLSVHAGATRYSRRQWFACSLQLTTLSLGAGCSKAREFRCDQTVGLTPQELQVRRQLAYVDRSLNEATTCANCQQYLKPVGDEPCGGCKVMPGPAHPNGYCKVWVLIA